MKSFKNIPTNIISGFLGSGKTTAIQHLLTLKPKSEVWAVIVNEFGKIGIDGELLKNDKVKIKQIPGGCLCCVGSQLLSVGLNEIIRTINPRRIIIEPTGLGHPAKLIAALTGEFYRSVIDLKGVINLIDARQLGDIRYMKNEAYIDQSIISDVLVANKLDLYAQVDKESFIEYAKTFQPEKEKVVMVEQGMLKLDWLDYTHSTKRTARFPYSHNEQDKSSEVYSNAKWFIVEGYASGFHSLGWRLDEEIMLDWDGLKLFVMKLFKNQDIERVKGIVRTSDDWCLINCTKTEKTFQVTGSRENSVLEIISSLPLETEEINVFLKSKLTN